MRKMSNILKIILFIIVEILIYIICYKMELLHYRYNTPILVYFLNLIVSSILATIFLYLLYGIVDALFYKDLSCRLVVSIKSGIVLATISVVTALPDYVSLISFLIVLFFVTYIFNLKRFEKLRDEGYYGLDISISKKSIMYPTYAILVLIVIVISIIVPYISLRYNYGGDLI